MRTELVRPHAGHRLVEQKKARLCRERHRYFKLPMFAVAQPCHPHGRAFGEPNAGERGQRRLAQFVGAARVAPKPERMAAMRLHRERNIVDRGEVAKTAT